MKKAHWSIVVRVASSLAMVTLLASCGKNPALVKKCGEQEIEIARLQTELAALDEKLRNLPQDRSPELAKARKTAQGQAAEVARVEAEISQLQVRKANVEMAFDEYKRKYAVR
jgi:predicted trehalose synthase